MNSPADNPLDRVLVLEMVRVTEAAAVAASKLIGRGDEKAADAAIEVQGSPESLLALSDLGALGNRPVILAGDPEATGLTARELAELVAVAWARQRWLKRLEKMARRMRFFPPRWRR